MDFLSLKNQKNLISGVKLFKLKVNRDERGFLTETLKTGWKEILNEEFPFTQTYYSQTNAWIARDENQWHYHPTKQRDRFVVLKGNLVVAIYDWRKNSPTKGFLNLFPMGEKNGDDDQFLLFIPLNVLHGFTNVGPKPCYLLNYPTSLYDPQEEGRAPMEKAGVKFEDGSPFAWEVIRQKFK